MKSQINKETAPMAMPKQTVGEGVKFERIRRITGYLTGSTDGWNNAKRAEERDRVKHTTRQLQQKGDPLEP